MKVFQHQKHRIMAFGMAAVLAVSAVAIGVTSLSPALVRAFDLNANDNWNNVNVKPTWDETALNAAGTDYTLVIRNTVLRHSGGENSHILTFYINMLRYRCKINRQ